MTIGELIDLMERFIAARETITRDTKLLSIHNGQQAEIWNTLVTDDGFGLISGHEVGK